MADAWDSDSENEYDRRELEIALYSKIHFDASTEIETPYKKESSPLRIKVEELPSRITPSVKKPIFSEEFIAFSSIKSTSGEALPCSNSKLKEDESSLKSQSNVFDSQHKTTLIQPSLVEATKEKIKSENFIKFEDAISESSDNLTAANFLRNRTVKHTYSSNSKPAICSLDNTEVLTAESEQKNNVREIDSSFDKYGVLDFFNPDISSAILTKDGTKSSTPRKNKVKAENKMKEKEILLPYSLTKSSVKLITAKKENNSSEKDVLLASFESVGKKKGLHTVKGNLAKLESFLQLSKPQVTSKGKKKAKLSKTDAAVKPRKPAVLLRRPPAVSVKYRQDSDTNTDYSDSDISSNASPQKMQLKSSKANSPLKSSSQTRKKIKSEHCCEKQVSIDLENIAGSACNDEKFQNKERVKREEVEEEKSGALEEVDVSCMREQDGKDVDEEIEADEGETGEKEMEDECEDAKEGCSTRKEVLEVGSDDDESSSDSDGTDRSDPDDFLTDTIPGLQFNLDLGLEELAFTKSGTENWKINEKDRLNMVSTLSRYFIPRMIECRNCKTQGHLSRDCPLPLKRRCIFCGQEGHSYQSCPSAICFNCSAPGHRSSKCTEPKQSWKAQCRRCWMSGHTEEKCPDRWRQYHITVHRKESKLVTTSKDAKNPLVFCYNCGKKGHLGYECKLSGMNKFVMASYPFIARYDTKNNRKEMKIARVKDSASTSTHHKDKKKEKRRNKSNDWRDKNDDQHPGSKGKRKRQKQGQEVESFNIDSQDFGKNREFLEINHNDPMKNKSMRRGKKRKDNNEHNIKIGARDHGNKGIIQNTQGSRGTVFRRDSRAAFMDHQQGARYKHLSDDDILNDFEHHQVKDNQWWKKEKPATKRRKRYTETFSSDADNNWLGDEHLMRGESHAQIFQSSPIPVAGRALFGRGSWKHKHGQIDQDKHTQRVSAHDSSLESTTYYVYRDSDNLFHGRQPDNDFFMINHGGRSTFDDHESARLHHSATWPVLPRANTHFTHNESGFQSRKETWNKANSQSTGYESGFHSSNETWRKAKTGFSGNKGGFQAHNERFVAMKRNCDITVNFRK